ncbi:LysM peptidoglycan-binding domain-containing protein [Pedobacter alluvionis]|uniref:LysM peptidoglycan-binding domain-containing protein n=1 Tax=Pedobacter alluvionis TaxID=475253 RepID=A0A497YAH6_9SPHI|nr:LysM peptidoglycan-binding domain-containing protein [Pedobacter alluvionis]RLJ80572.1 LysM repeat protein [Pedobacter alluvionis]TFB31838.1 LysM peptidoglycan-binding domain-containing protein [Pedobacter alluvionis]
MHKIYLSAVVLFALNIANAKANTARDSIGVENNKGKKLIVHQTVAKDTYYSIGRRYNVSPKDIMAFNENKYLQVGVIIKVPTNIPFTATGSSNNAQAQTAATGNVIEHTIKPKENLNMLAEKYGTTINEIKTLNNLKGSNLSIGQVLKIPAKNGAQNAATEPVTSPVKNNTESPVNSTPASDQTMIEHTVARKEFLGKIAEKYGTTVEEVKKVNNLSGNNLRIGQKLKIPATKNIDETKAVSATVEEKPKQENKSSDTAGTHTVLRNETIFTIAKQYGITAYQIRTMNNLPDNAITIGQVLKVPGGIIADVQVPKEKQAETKTKEVPVEAKEESFIHTVATGENIFSIAKKYNLTAYQIRTANKLDDNNIKVGQKLIIPKPPQPKSVNDLSKEQQENEPDSTMVKDPKLRRDPSVYGLSQIEEKGAAVWIEDQDMDGTKMLVLHRTAPVGRVIKITNPMTNRTTFAKVVGKFTENESTKDVIIVMTKAVADSLGALDKRFFCNLTYSAQ